MSSEMMSSQECLILIAYLNFLKSLNGTYEKRTQVNKFTNTTENPRPHKKRAHRPEPVRRRGRKSGQTLHELLSQMPDYKAHCEAVKARIPKPHRSEPVRQRRKKPQYTQEELLAQMTDGNCHEEVDTGAAVGSEVWSD